MIKISHTHENGKVCYTVRSNHSLTNGVMFLISGIEFAVAYMPYTGSYYAFNPKTGQEVATFSKEFYESIERFKIGEFIKDKDCK